MSQEEHAGHVGSCRIFYAEARCTCAEGWEQRLENLARARRRARCVDIPRVLERLADRWLPPRWRWLLGDDAMLHQRDLRRIASRRADS